ncbi:hypothetical protein DITRI_Ditri16bG0105700 [Diplodiscus trichospermus]
MWLGFCVWGSEVLEFRCCQWSSLWKEHCSNGLKMGYGFCAWELRDVGLLSRVVIVVLGSEIGFGEYKRTWKIAKTIEDFQFGSKSDDFALAIAKVAVAQVCESVEFQSFQHSALETLSDIIVRYIYSIGKTANFNANLAGRVEENVFDLIQGLEELGSGLGFAGASDVDR